MNDEAKRIIAFLMKRSGKNALPESEFYLTISMDMQWCPPKLAKEFVKKALSADLLEKKNDLLSPTFDVKNVTIPTGFHPSESSFKIDEGQSGSTDEDIVKTIINEINRSLQQSSKEILQKIEVIANEKMVSIEVAAILYAKKHQIDIEPFLSLVKDAVFKENIK